MTALLLHGPSAAETMLQEPDLRGWFKPLPAFGMEGGLKVDAAREFVWAVQNPPPTDLLCVYMANISNTADRVQDVLLKILEEHDTKRVTLLLSVHDIGTVIPTIQSRCHERWCGGEVESPALLGVAQGILQDLKSNRMAEALEPLRKKGVDAGDLLDALSAASKNDPAVWVKLRPLHGYTNLSLTDLLGALL